jgi:Domain of unknown function (DUF4232)
MELMNSRATPVRRLGFLAGAAGLAGLITACGSNPAAISPPPSSPATTPAAGGTSPAAPSASATTPSSSAGTAACVTSDLQARLGEAQGAAGTFYQVVVLTNTSSSACSLYGYPGVSFVTGVGGKVIGAPATRNTGIRDALVTLRPGGEASTLVGVEDVTALPAGKCHTGKADWLQIYPPGDTGALYVQYKAEVCTNASQKFMTDGAVRAGTRGGTS